MKRFALLLVFWALFACFTTKSYSQAPRTMNAAEIKLALNKLNKVCSVLYIAAHPDDENNAVLAYLSNETLCRTGYLSLTRGEGGQNLLGTEKGDALGVIRTQELLAARRIDGAEQFFTRAVDFGFSKTSEETLRLWNKQEVLSDVVFTIRKFRPDVIITRFPPDERAGHGHHQSSAILAAEAFKLAGDKNAFPEQLKYVQIWQPKRLVWNAFVRGNDAPPPDSIKVDVGKYNPLLGKSYTEIAAEARSMHKTQGFGSGAVRGSRIEYFQHVAGEKAINDMFDGIDTSWKRFDGGDKLNELLQQVRTVFQPDNPSVCLPLLFSVKNLMQEIKPNKGLDEQLDILEKFKQENLLTTKIDDLEKIIPNLIGLRVEAIALEPIFTQNTVTSVNLLLTNRSTANIGNSGFSIKSQTVQKQLIEDASGLRGEPLISKLETNQTKTGKLDFNVQGTDLTQPFWLRKNGNGYLADLPFSDDSFLSKSPYSQLAENPASFICKPKLYVDKTRLYVTVPILYRYVDRVRGEIYQPFVIAPNLTANLSESVFVFADDKPKTVRVNLRAFAPIVKGKVFVKLPEGYLAEKNGFPVDLKKGEETTIDISVVPSICAPTGKLELEFQDENQKSKTENQALKQFQSIDYEHIPRQVIFPDASAKLVKIELNRGNERIGYVQGSGDEIPESLRQIGYDVKLLSDEDLQNADLSASFDTIIIGIRAYNVRETLKRKNSRVLDFVKNGGNVIVQYNTTDETLFQNFAPFPLKISRDRITDENSPVKFLDDKNAVLNSPNKITPEDFKGWTQERGTYFAGEFSKDYTPILQMNDPNEKDLNGALLTANYGKGKFVYSGLAFFRQLPNGNAGAFKLFVNLISK